MLSPLHKAHRRLNGGVKKDKNEKYVFCKDGMRDQGGSCTLIFYRIGKDFWNEPLLNLVSAAAQMSPFSHVEIAIGDEAGSLGQMSNVARIFNDDIGVSKATPNSSSNCNIVVFVSTGRAYIQNWEESAGPRLDTAPLPSL